MAQQSITLQTSDADVIGGDIIGRVNFAASNETSGSEAKWIAASVFAEASGEFTATANPTNLVFATSDADGIVARHKITNVGHFVPNINSTYNLGSSSLKYNNIFAATGTIDRVNTTGIQLTTSVSRSGLLYVNNSDFVAASPNVLFSNADLASPKLIFKASGSLTPDISLNMLTTATNVASGVQTLSVQGSAGELFSITDVLDSGTIFSVNDISGLGLIEADADGTVTLVRYGSNVAVGNVVPTQKLHVAGNIRVSGAFFDSTNSPGTSGQVLVSTSGGTDWRSLGEITGVDGVGASGYVARWTDGDTIGTGIIYDNGTNIGIGTASPSYRLHIVGTSNQTITIQASGNAVVNFAGNNNTNPFSFNHDGTDLTLTEGSRNRIRVRNAGNLSLFSRNNSSVATERLTVTDIDGYIGINNNSPTSQLQINSSTATTTGVIVRGAAAQTADLFQVQNSAGTALARIDSAGSISGVASGIFMQRVGIGTSAPIERLDVRAGSIRLDESWHLDWGSGSERITGGNSSTNYSLILSTYDSRVPNITEKMRITGFGDVGIGTSAPAHRLDVRGTGYFSESVRTSGTVVFASGNTGGVGVMRWDDGEGTVSLGLKGGNIDLEIGQEQLTMCYNGTGSTLTKGKVVYIVGAQGQKPSIALASNTTELTSSKTLGVVAEDIGIAAEGFVATYGTVRNLDTSAFIEGSGLWLGASGNMTMIRPTQPLHGVHIGYCLKNSASAGRIFVRVQNGFEIEELHDVLIQSPASGNLLQYDGSVNLWRNRTRSEAGLVEGVGTSGYIARWTGTNTIATGVVYDNGTNVGIGTTSPSYKLSVNGSGEFTNGIYANNIEMPYTMAIGRNLTTNLVLENLDAPDNYWGGLPDSEENGSGVILIGDKAGVFASGIRSTLAIGNVALASGTDAPWSVFVGRRAGYNSDSLGISVAIGGSALSNARKESAEDIGFTTAVGYGAGINSNLGGRGSTFFGVYAGGWAKGGFYSTFIGPLAGRYASGLKFCTGVGSSAFAGTSATNCAQNCEASVAINGGSYAKGFNYSVAILGGTYASGTNNVYVGLSAGSYSSGNYNIELLNSGSSLLSNTLLSNKLHVNRLIGGDFESKKLAIGNVISNTSLSPNATLEVLPKATTDVGVIVQGAISQTADFVQLKNSAGTTLFDIDAAGSLSGVGSGIFMQRLGVGTSTPDGALDVVTDANGSFYFGNKNDTVKVNTIVFRQANHSSEPEGYAALCNTSIDNSFNSLSIGGGSVGHNAFTSINLVTASDSSVRQGTTRLRIISNGNVGIGTFTPSEMLHVNGNIRVSGAYYDSNNSAGTNGQVLTSTATGTDWKSLSEITGVDGVGTSGYVARWVDTDTIGTGVIYDNGTNVGIGTTSPSYKLSVNGSGEFINGLYAKNIEMPYTMAIGRNLTDGLVLDNLDAVDPYYYLSDTEAAGSGVVLIGDKVGVFASGIRSTVAIGNVALASGINAPWSVFIGRRAGQNSDGSPVSVAVGAQALSNAKRSSSTDFGFTTAVGYAAGANSRLSGRGSTFIGANAGQNTVESSYTTFAGVNAGWYSSGVYEVVAIGSFAFGNSVPSYTNGPRNSQISIGIGTSAALASKGFNYSTAIGYNAGSYASGDYNIYLGNYAGINSSGNYNIEIVNSGVVLSTSSLLKYTTLSNKLHIGRLIGGDFESKKLAVGNVISTTNLSPDATLEVLPKATTDVGVIIQGVAAQTADFLQVQNSAGTILLDIDAAGSLSGVGSGIFMGRVGVGTSNPTSLLHVVGGTADTICSANIENLANFSGFNDVAVLYTTGKNSGGTTVQGAFGVNTAWTTAAVGGVRIGSTTNHAFSLGTNNIERMRITNVGAVGIGTTSPNNLLHVNGVAQATTLYATNFVGTTGVTAAYISDSSNLFLHSGSGAFVAIGNAAKEGMRITSAGNIGIGTTNPQYLLDVSGTIRANHVTAITKSFLIEHPTKPGKQLRYASLEGPENGVYIRGITTDNEIELPEYWAELVDLRSITVDLTALKYPQPNLYVEKITSRSIKIGSDRPVMASYTVYGERKDVPKLEVEC